MSAERFARVKELVLAASERGAAERAAYLDRACGDDTALRAEVESLLAHQPDVVSIVRSGALAGDLEGALADALRGGGSRRAPDRIGPYRVLEPLGQGGMGEVFRAEQDEPIRRVVALKLIRRGLDSREFFRRFEAERRILARLEHPGIARLIDGGLTDDGVPWFTMEYVDGVPIDRYCDERALGVAERLRLVREVCAAVQYAHRNLIVHRDLKPGNILVTEDGTVKLLDFGIAKVLGPGATGGEPAAEPPLTRADSRLLTPAYAAPEQVRNEPVTTATDVYSLGVILYELLCGSRPYVAAGGSTHELESAILEAEPVAPSATLHGAAAHAEPAATGRSPGARAAARGTAPDRLRRELAGDLDSICLKALRKEPERRYSSADELEADLRRHAEGRPVLARRDTFGYRAVKFIRRHRGAVAATVAVVLLVAAIVGVYTVRLREQRDRATEARDASDAVTEFLSGMLRAPDPGERGRDVTVLAVLDSASRKIEQEFAARPAIAGRLELAVGRAYHGLGQYGPAREHLERAAAIAGARLGRDAPERRSARQYLAVLATDQGRFREAESLTTLNLADRRRLLGPEHPEALESVNALADLRARLGRQAEAESLLLWNLAARRRVLGEEHEQTLNTIGLLANLYADQSRFKEAEPLYARQLVLRRRDLGPEHPHTLSTMNNLALVYMQTARYAEAEPLYLETLAARRRVEGEDHPDMVGTLYNLGILYSELGRFAESESLLTRVVNAFRREFGEEGPRTLIAKNNLARMYARAKRYREAETLFRSTLAARRRVLGAEHPSTLGTRVNLAGVLRDGGHTAEAEALFRETLAIQRRVLGPRHANTLNTSYQVGLLHLRAGEAARAQAFLDSATTGVGATFGREHVDWARYATALGECLTRLGRLDEAAAVLDSAGAIAARTRPPGDAQLRDIAAARAALEEARGSAGEARARRERAGR
jgi:serine/threonine-protein kinase